MQNPNESCNNIASTRFPRTIYVTRSIMEVVVNSAFLHFSEGTCVISNTLLYFKIGMVVLWKKLASKGIKSVDKNEYKNFREWENKKAKL